jgi:hypothetical protein
LAIASRLVVLEAMGAMNPERQRQSQGPSQCPLLSQSHAQPQPEPSYKEAAQWSGVQQEVKTIPLPAEIIQRVQQRMPRSSDSQRILKKLHSKGVRTKDDLRGIQRSDLMSSEWIDTDIDVVLLDDDAWAKQWGVGGDWAKNFIREVLGDLAEEVQNAVLDIFQQKGIQNDSELLREFEQMKMPAVPRSKIRKWAEGKAVGNCSSTSNRSVCAVSTMVGTAGATSQLHPLAVC